MIPAAGVGTRVRPITNTLPKALVPVAGKPTIFHILDYVISLGVTSFIIIVGYLKDLLIKEIQREYADFNIEFVEQKEQLGLGHAVLQSEPFFLENESMLLIYGDTLFFANLECFFLEKKYSYLGVIEVEDPQRFGIVKINSFTNMITDLVEKPEHPKTNLAIAGVNFILNAQVLFDSIHYIVNNGIKTKNEYQITDAFSHMIHNKKQLFKSYRLDSWFDVGTLKTVLATNKRLLENKKERRTIDCSADIQNSQLGDYVSVGKNVKIINSCITNCIIDNGAILENIVLKNSIIGRNVCLKNFEGECVLGDYSIIGPIV